jgi:replicative DNA helicase
MDENKNFTKKFTKKKDTFSEHGKVQPQATNLEEAVLGALMLDKDAVALIIDILRPASFYKEAHQHIYKAICILFEKSHPIDLLTVTEELKKLGKLEIVGGPYQLVELTNRVASSANIEFHARIIAQKFIQRELIRSSTETIRAAYEDTVDVFDLLDSAEQNLFNITEQNLSRGSLGMSTLVNMAVKQLEEMSGKEEGLTGVPTGFVGLDKLTSGWQPSDLIIIAARPGMGKTAFTMAVARNAAIDFNKGVAFFSLEMSSLQLVNRLISMETEIPSEKLRKGQLEDYEWQQLHAQVDKLSNVPLFIDDTPGISIFELRAKCRRLKMQHDIQMVVVDYLQLMTGGGDNKGNREQEISMISRGLKGLAKELSVPVIALSQLSRAVETRGGDKRPQLSDLRECVTGDTLVYIASTGLYQRVDELIGKKGFEVLAVDKHQQLQKAICLDVWETGEKEIFELTTQSGYTIKTSANHPFYTIDGWKELETLQEGSYVATPRHIDYDKENQALLDQEIILLAHMIGDGCFVERQPIHYTSQDLASLDIVENCANQLWKIEGRRVKDVNSKSCYHLYLPSPYPLTHGVRHPFSLLLEKLGLTFARSHEKTVPNAIFNSSTRQVALFIHHIWATDGGIFIRKSKGSSKVYYSSNSIQLIQQLQSLLLRFEISASINKGQKENYKPNYTLNITGKENISKFHNYISIHGTKIKTLEELVALNETKQTVPDSDVIPKYLWNNIKDIKRAKGFTERKFQAALEMSYSGSSLYRSNISRNRLNKIADLLESEELLDWANSAIKWEKIVSIKPIGKEMTYDIHVENYHNFVANNFIIHNSGAIEQDADIVSFIYRPEYYQILEDEEGNSLKGIGEIIVAKHRNGALDSVRLKWDAQYAKFSNLDDDAFTGLDDSSFFDQANNEVSGETFSSKINKTNENDNGIDDVPF